MNPVIELVIGQIDDAFLYIPAGCVWAGSITAVVLALGMALKFCLHKDITLVFIQKLLVSFFFIVYVYCVLQLTIISRKPGNFGEIDWRFLARWNESNMQKAFLIANIIMFIPLGVLLPMINKWTKHILISLPIAALCSVCIEAVQLKYQLGYCQLDDVAANSIGFLIGFLVYLVIADIYSFIYNVCNACIKILTKKNGG